MCGRYSLFLDAREVGERFDAAVPDDLPPRYNAAPGETLPVVTNHDPDRVTGQRWGLVPSWADDGFDGIVNARAETLAEKPSFADARERRRCLVLADGYYEWRDEGGERRPHRFTLPGGDPFAMAGVWERWRPTTTQTDLAAFGSDDANAAEPDAEAVETFAVVTTAANEFQSDYHDRMPAILDPGEEREWLADPDAVSLGPYGGEMRAHPVSSRVNDPTNDSPDLVEPVEG